jgi:hypothetical protein
MSNGKIWAKIVDNEIMQTHDCHPGELWHIDMIEQNELTGHWEEVPEHANVGWKFKNNEWISGGQWMEEFREENPIPPPGPPVGRIDHTVIVNNQTHKAKVNFDIHVGGIYDSFFVEVDGVKYENLTETEKIDFTLEFDMLDEAREIPISITTTGPGGIHVEEIGDDESERKLIIPEKWVPPFMKALAAQGNLP